MGSGREKPPREVSGSWRGAGRKAASASRPERGGADTPVRAGDDAIPLGRLTKRAEFLYVRGGRQWRTPSFVLQARPRAQKGADEAGCARFGFTVTKRLGSATKRNRARRRLREAVRLVAGRHARSGHDYVVIARQGALTSAFGDIQEELRTALRRVHERTAKR